MKTLELPAAARVPPALPDARPLAIDLFCGLGGWAEGFLAEGYRVVGFDNERHRYPARDVPESTGVKTGGDWSSYGKPGYIAMGFNVENAKRLRLAPLTGGWSEYPGDLVLQDVLTLHGSQFLDAAIIVASPPCQNYSYLAMPWSRSKPVTCKACGGNGKRGGIGSYPCGACGGDGQVDNSRAAKALRKKWETEGPDNRLFDACFRIQREAIEATARVCENCDGIGVWPRGTTEGTPFPGGKCVCCDGKGKQFRHIPLIMENVCGAQPWVGRSAWNFGSFHLWGDVPALMPFANSRKRSGRNFHVHALTGGAVSSPSFHGGDHETRDVGPGTQDGIKQLHSRGASARFGSKSNARKMASAQIAKIPLALAQHIAQVYYPRTLAQGPRPRDAAGKTE